MRWLVDGYNVIRRDPDLRGHEAQGLQAGRTALLHVLAAAARATGDEFTVVFDGERRAAGAPSGGQVQALFSRPPESADDVLRRLARSGTAVVSSDRAVRVAAARAGAVAVTAEAFIAAVRGHGGDDEDDQDLAERDADRRGNPNKRSREERAGGRALRRLSSKLTGEGPIG